MFKMRNGYRFKLKTRWSNLKIVQKKKFFYKQIFKMVFKIINKFISDQNEILNKKLIPLLLFIDFSKALVDSNIRFLKLKMNLNYYRKLL